VTPQMRLLFQDVLRVFNQKARVRHPFTGSQEIERAKVANRIREAMDAPDDLDPFVGDLVIEIRRSCSYCSCEVPKNCPDCMRRWALIDRATGIRPVEENGPEAALRLVVVDNALGHGSQR
jgi:hypothetical protein